MDIDHAAGTTPSALSGLEYSDFFPYYAELSALTELKKKPGFGAPLHSGIGGHLLLYLNGVRRDHSAGYPALRLCTEAEPPAEYGVGISVNAHFRNANWIAVEGADFLWHGDLAPGEPVTREAYARTQARAKAMGILDGVEFHPELFRTKPPGMSDVDFMYEISIGTDYGAQFGRDTFRIRVPLDRARMQAIVDELNLINAPYRTGQRIFRWHVINNNCAHAARNALAAAGLMPAWPTGQFIPVAAFCFPVPKNEFVDLVLRANDLPIEEPAEIYKDGQARASLLANGTLPTAPGALASTHLAMAGNDIYDTKNLRLIFFDNPFWGPYRFRLKRIFATPRYTDLYANMQYFSHRYAVAQARGQGTKRAPGPTALFFDRYEQHVAREAEKLRQQLARWEEVA